MYRFSRNGNKFRPNVIYCTIQINKNFDQRVKLITFKHQSVIFMDKLKSAGFIIKESKYLTRSCCTKIFNYFPRVDLILIFRNFNFIKIKFKNRYVIKDRL